MLKKLLWFIFVAALTYLACTNFVQAQSQTCAFGIVSLDGEPVPFESVRLFDSNNQVVAAVLTNEVGYFEVCTRRRFRRLRLNVEIAEQPAFNAVYLPIRRELFFATFRTVDEK